MTQPAPASTPPSEPERSPEASPLAGWVLTLALLLAGLVFAHGALVSSGGDGLPGDGDVRLNTLILEHDWQWLRGDPLHARLFSPPWFWPHENTLAYSENLLGTLPAYALLRLAGLSPFGALQAWTVVCSLASFAAMFALARGLGATRAGAGLGAFLFAFALSRGAQECQHAQLLPHAASALCLLAAARGRPFLAAAAFAWQAWCSIYLGFFLALEVVLALAAALALGASREALLAHLRRRWAAWALAPLLAGLLLAPLAPPYLAARGELSGGHGHATIASFLPVPASYALPGGHTLLYRGLLPLAARVPNAHEQALFAGFLPWLALGAGLLLASRRPAGEPAPPGAGPAFSPALAPLLATGPLVALATLSVGGLSLWLIAYRWIPGASAIRAVSRVGMVELLPLGLALAWAASALERRAARAGSRLPLGLPLALAALVVLENAGFVPHASSKRALEERSAAVARSLEGRPCDAFLAVARPEDDAVWLQLEAMEAVDRARLPTLNGYSGWAPPGWGPLALVPSAEAPGVVAAWLQREGRDPAAARVVVVTPHAPDPGGDPHARPEHP